MSRPRQAPGLFGKLAQGLVALAIAALLAAIGLAVLLFGFEELRELRQLERTPRSLVASILPGEVNLQGTAQARHGTLQAPETGTATLYYRHHIEREKKDSDGNTRWETIHDERRFVPFALADESGEIRIEPSARVGFEAPSRFSRRAGDRRYTEYRLDPGDDVFVFGIVTDETRPVVGFDADGAYTPLISAYGEAEARGGMARVTLFLLWLGLAVIGAAVYALLWALRVHLSYVYLGALSTAAAMSMLGLAISTAGDDLAASFERTMRDIGAAERQIERRYRQAGLAWDGDWSHVGEQGWEAGRLGEAEQRLLHHLRERIALQIEATDGVRRQFPERIVAWTMDLPVLPDIGLPSDVDDAPIRRARVSHSGRWSGPVALAMLLLATLFAWLGFRWVRLKRTIENLPTSRTAGAAYGLVELKGAARLAEGDAALIGPLSQRPCVWFHYIVKERRGSGKNAKWVTIEDRRVDRRFLIEDEEGRLPVIPDGAEAIVTCQRSRQQGRMRYSESWIEPGTPLYLLGSAEIDPATGDSLRIARGPKSQPFLLTDLDEDQLKLRKARGAFALLNVGVSTGNAAALAAIGSIGALHGAGFLFAALAPLGFFAVFLAIVMYNDLVTLRQRVRLTWANIQVSLAKRADLVPRLESVLKAYLQHERGLQEDLARLRSLSGRPDIDPAAAALVVAAEQGVIAGFAGLREAYPELKANALAMQLSGTLIRLENEVALMRQGYNDAVERYNTRREQIPEVIFTRMFKFQPGQSFRAEMEVRAVPSIALEEAVAG